VLLLQLQRLLIWLLLRLPRRRQLLLLLLLQLLLLMDWGLTDNNVYLLCLLVVDCRDDMSAGCVQKRKAKHCRHLRENVGRANLTVAACSDSKHHLWFCQHICASWIVHLISCHSTALGLWAKQDTVPNMTYNVFGGTLNLAQSNPSKIYTTPANYHIYIPACS